MRDIGARSLGFWLAWLCAASPACAPAVPDLEVGREPAADGGVERRAPAEAAVVPASPSPPLGPDAAAPPDAATLPDAAVQPDAAVLADAPREAPGDAPREAPGDAPREAPGDVAPAREAASESSVDAPREASAGGRAPRAGDVRIEELLVDPTGNDLGHEWIELANASGEALDLAALHVADGADDVAVPAGGLAPGARLVLGQSIDRAHNGDAPVDRAYGTRLALNNGGDRLAVCLGPCADGLVLDVFEWTAAWGEAYVGHAVVVEGAARATCPAPEPYGAAGNFGSPGRANAPCAETADAGAGDD